MQKNRYLFGLFLASILMCSTFMAVSAQTIDPTATSGPWEPPKGFIDPVTLTIQKLTKEGLNEEQITTELEKLGMGWYPKTGATWIGSTPTPEELAKLPISMTASDDSNAEQSARTLTKKVSSMRTNGYSWTGVSAEMICGSMSVASGQTLNHYVCVQIGDLDGITNWAETLVMHNYGEVYKWYTYDSDEGGFSFYMNKNTASSAVDTYVILLDGTQDGGGWHYDVWINYQWVRRAHLSNLWVQSGYQKEVYSNGQYTNDGSSAIFYRNWLHNAQGWSYWTNAVSTSWTATYPVREAHSMGAVSYNWNTWVQN